MHRVVLTCARQPHSRYLLQRGCRAVSTDSKKPNPTPETVELDNHTLLKLERLSGLQFESQQEIDDLREEIRLANQIFEVDTKGVKPLYSIVEELIDCPLREDEPVKPDQSKIFANAAENVEGFFVSPPANILVDESPVLETRQIDTLSVQEAYRLVSRPGNASSSSSSKDKSSDLMATRQRSGNGRIKTVGDWSEQISSTGKRYYYDEKNGISQWKKPEVWKEYEKKLAERLKDRQSSSSSSSKQNDHKNHSNSSKRNSPSNNHGLNGELDDRRRIVSKPSTSNNIPSSSSRFDQPRHSSNRHIHSSSSNSNALKRESVTPILNGTAHSSSPHVNNADTNGSGSSGATPIARGTPTNYESSKKSYRRDRDTSDEFPRRREFEHKQRQPEPESQSSLSDALQPPPMAPDLVMDEPMEVESPPPPPAQEQPEEPAIFLPPPIPSHMPFNEANYINNRFYHPKLCAYRKQISYEGSMNDIKETMKKAWKAEKDLIELETSIVSVQSLVLTARYNAELQLIQPAAIPPQQNGGESSTGTVTINGTGE